LSAVVSVCATLLVKYGSNVGQTIRRFFPLAQWHVPGCLGEDDHSWRSHAQIRTIPGSMVTISLIVD
jgi:hypothetical protein